jgi:type IV secretory pathway ATPase VirB11/archaellum biosynthesis ATPase
VHFTPSLRALLGSVEELLADSAVEEVIVLEPDRVLVRRSGKTAEIPLALSKAKIQSLAERLQKDSGLLGDAFSSVIVPSAGSMLPPIIRIARCPVFASSLQELSKDCGINPLAELLLLEAVSLHRSMLVTGPRASGKTALLAAIARELRANARVVIVEGPSRLLERSRAGHASLDFIAGAESAVALGADVIIVDEPPPRVLLDILLKGRPFVLSLEASQARAGLVRLTALVLSAAESLSKAAADALIESAIGVIVETASDRGRARVKRVLELGRERAAAAEGAIPSPSPRRKEPRTSPRRHQSSPGNRARGDDASVVDPTVEGALDLASMAAIPRETVDSPSRSEPSGSMALDPRELSDLRAEQLVSQSYAMRLKEVQRAAVPGRAPSGADSYPDEERTLDGGASKEVDDPSAPSTDKARLTGFPVEEGSTADHGDLPNFKRRLAEASQGRPPDDERSRALAGPPPALRLSSAEFDAVLDELRDVTPASSFDSERDQTETAGADPKPPGSDPIDPSSTLRRGRPRGA